MANTASSSSPLVSIRRLSREGVPSIHRFYDTSPLSPSGRLVAITEFDQESRLPAAGDEASVVVLDARSGDEVYRTRTIAWDTQLGAQVQWGTDDDHLFFNRMSTTDWHPYAVAVAPTTGAERRLGGPVYMVSPDGKTLIAPNLARIWLVQPGYGVIVPPEHRVEPAGAQNDDGIFVTDVESGSTKLGISLEEIHERLPEAFNDVDLSRGGFYGFHTKWSPDGERIMFVLRWRDRFARKGQSKNWLITMRSDFSDLHVAITPQRWVGGHHPNWCPDGEHIVMNLAFPRWTMRNRRFWHLADRAARRLHIPFYPGAFALRFAKFRYDGSDLNVVAPLRTGSGHPTWHEALESVLTDAYPWEAVAAGDGTSPLRLVSAISGDELTLATVRTQPRFAGPRREWRVDPHPAWNYDATRFVFNSWEDGVRGVYVADMSVLVNEREPG